MRIINKERQEKQKKPYVKPVSVICPIQLEQNLMIPVSGTTTPEESQAKQFDLWTDGEDDIWKTNHPDLWEEEE